MNYFDLFEIPVQLKIDKAGLQKKFIELSRKYHPDYFIGEESSKQAEALEKSATLNKALKTLQNPDDTIKYVLLQKGLMKEEEKYELPRDFLMEVLDINESLMEADSPEAIKNIKQAIGQIQNEIYEPVKETVEHYQDSAVSEKELLQVKEYYYKKKYLDRITRHFKGKL